MHHTSDIYLIRDWEEAKIKGSKGLTLKPRKESQKHEVMNLSILFVSSSVRHNLPKLLNADVFSYEASYKEGEGTVNPERHYNIHHEYIIYVYSIYT